MRLLPLLLLCGCEASLQEVPDATVHGTFELVSSGGWTEDVDCEEGFGAEQLGSEQVFSVDTADCNPFEGHQRSLAPVYEGDLVSLHLWHFELTAPEPAVARVAIALGERYVFEERIDIPADPELKVLAWRADERFDAGTLVRFEVENHGANSWALVRLTTNR